MRINIRMSGSDIRPTVRQQFFSSLSLDIRDENDCKHAQCTKQTYHLSLRLSTDIDFEKIRKFCSSFFTANNYKIVYSNESNCIEINMKQMKIIARTVTILNKNMKN